MSDQQIDREIGTVLKKMPGNRVVRLNNVTCVYCGTPLTRDTSTKEHVIGRRFVPKGKLHGNWNLIVNACKPCNAKKSDLEDDISAITMQPDVLGRYGHKDEAAASEAERKAKKAFSRRTKKTVKDSKENMTVNIPFGRHINFSFDIIGPPQVEQQRLFDLARLQLMGFFYWTTFDKSSRRGRFWPDGFWPVLDALRSDWGNPLHRAFMDSVVQWEPRILACTGDGFYKVAIRQHPDADCWSWALEWNHSLRIVGFFGDARTTQEIVSGFPKLELQTATEGPDQSLYYHLNTPLDKTEDKLFATSVEWLST